MRKTGLLLLALLLVITPLSVSGDTVSRAYLETVASLSAQYGEYSAWPLHAKLAWVQALHDTGPASARQDTAALLCGNGTPEAQAQAIDDYLVGRYGTGGHLVTVNLYYCLTGELGPAYAWTLEDQAWISQLYLTNFPGQWDRMVCSLPGDDVISPDEAIAIAQDAIAQAYQLPDGAGWAAAYTVSLMYGVPGQYLQDTAPYYTVMFGEIRDGSNPEMQPYGIRYACYVTGDGQVMDSNWFVFTPSPAEQAAQ